MVDIYNAFSLLIKEARSFGLRPNRHRRKCSTENGLIMNEKTTQSAYSSRPIVILCFSKTLHSPRYCKLSKPVSAYVCLLADFDTASICIRIGMLANLCFWAGVIFYPFGNIILKR